MIDEKLFKTGLIVAYVGQEAEGNERLDRMPLKAFVFSRRPEGYILRIGSFLLSEFTLFCEEIRVRQSPFSELLKKVERQLNDLSIRGVNAS